MRRLIPLLLLAFWFAGTAPSVAQTGDAILILDASGSMWGQVEGQTKISAARKAVDSILAKWKQTDRLGLMAYGHRTKGDCKDIELVVPVSAFDPDKIRSAVKGLNPKGKTPMADSLRAAAQALRSSENKATVILVSDGIETCSPDPCAVAAELKKAGVNFTAHVIGFDVADPTAKRQLQCIARATGGVYLDASNASSLEQALGKAVEAAQGNKVQSQAPAKAEPDPIADKNFRGIARLVAGGDPISDTKSDIGWTFHKSNVGQKGDFIAATYGSPAAENIEPG
ncbi:MAG: VWA domain-containing protein, partial [Xanthobacteraceae bacterium]